MQALGFLSPAAADKRVLCENWRQKGEIKYEQNSDY
jgi:hypothetical protein